MTTTLTDGVRPVDALAWIPVARIQPNPANPRKQLADIGDLARSIEAQGLIQPLVVTHAPHTDTYKLISGHRRHAALLSLRRPLALCVVRSGKSTPETLAMMLVENGQRVNLTVMEEARAYQALMREHGWSQAELGKRIGRSQASISSRVALLHLSPEEQAEVESGELRIGEAKRKARVAAGTDQKTIYTGWHFGKTHPLAPTAAGLCAAAGHKSTRRIGGGACGECWETAIRDDERQATP